MIVAIDPGKHKFAYAVGDTELFEAGYRDVSLAPAWDCWVIRVVELPQQRGRGSRVRVSDLIELAAVAGQLGGPHCEFAPVSAWKGSESKEAMHARLLPILNEEERRILSNVAIANSLRHNLLDAAALLMWRLGRLRTSGSKQYGPPKKEVRSNRLPRAAKQARPIPRRESGST